MADAKLNEQKRVASRIEEFYYNNDSRFCRICFEEKNLTEAAVQSFQHF
jgi:hypothetical protein